MKKFLFITIIALVALFGMSADLYAATAKIDSTDYATLSEAITAAGNTETTITLIDDEAPVERIKIPTGANITLDLNGKTLTLPSPEDNYGLVVAGNLTITGEGTINAGMYGIGVTGNLVIEGGTYNCEAGDYLIGSWGTVTIKDGTFNGNYCIANGFNGGTVEILDGEFTTNEETIVLGGTVVKGGTFSHDVDEYVDTTLDAVKDEKTGKYYVGTLNKVNVKETENGKVEVSLTEAIVEQVVEVKATANEGYKVKAIIVKDASGKEVEVVDGTFLMPDSEVTVEVTFEKVEAVKGELDDTPATGTMDKILVVSAIVAGAAVIAIAKKKQAMKNLI